MRHATDIRPLAASLHFLPVTTRVPLKFGSETLDRVSCARVYLRVSNRGGEEAVGCGETPLSVAWMWPGPLSFESRERVLKAFCRKLADAWSSFDVMGDAIEVGHAFLRERLPILVDEINAARPGEEPMPWLAALVCCSAFDLALHDAFGMCAGLPVYSMYGPEHLNRDLASYITPAGGARISFNNKFPRHYFASSVPSRLPVWHMVGGLDAVDPAELNGGEPGDGYPVLLRDWIASDGLRYLKFKLRGDDEAWDYARTVQIGQLALGLGVEWLTADFNCTVTDPSYVVSYLDRLLVEQPAIYARLLYVEQPFPYDLRQNPIDVHAISARKPLFMDESAHDWTYIAEGRALGWTGVALKTCKTQTGALLSGCWARAHGMTLMVQDLTNPMLAMIPHALLAANFGTIMGIESNAVQFYPDASLPEAAIHPGLYRRRDGMISLESIHGPGFGYRLDEIVRSLPDECGTASRTSSPLHP